MPVLARRLSCYEQCPSERTQRWASNPHAQPELSQGQAQLSRMLRSDSCNLPSKSAGQMGKKETRASNMVSLSTLLLCDRPQQPSARVSLGIVARGLRDAFLGPQTNTCLSILSRI